MAETKKASDKRPDLNAEEDRLKFQFDVPEKERPRFMAARAKLEKATGVPMTNSYFAKVVALKGLAAIEEIK